MCVYCLSDLFFLCVPPVMADQDGWHYPGLKLVVQTYPVMGYPKSFTTKEERNSTMDMYVTETLPLAFNYIQVQLLMGIILINCIWYIISKVLVVHFCNIRIFCLNT